MKKIYLQQGAHLERTWSDHRINGDDDVYILAEEIRELEQENAALKQELKEAINIVKDIKDIAIECSGIGIDTINEIIKERTK